MTTRALAILGFLALLAAVVCWLRLGVGGPLPPGSEVIWEIRWQRVIAGSVVGIGLATAGVLLQCLFRNPLASPDLLGMSSGAGVSVMFWQLIAFHMGSGIAQNAVDVGVALPGALGALALTYLLSQRRGMIEPVSLILTGVVVGIVAAALISLLQQLLPDRGVAAARLLLGSINDDVGWPTLAIVAAVTAMLLVRALLLAPAMDVASLSDDEARAAGVALGRLRLELFLVSGVLTGVTFALAGPVAFVGLVCPHLVRLATGPGHRVVLVGSALLAISMVVGADALVRVLDLGSGRLPISVLTAMLGGPLLIWMLRQRRTPGIT